MRSSARFLGVTAIALGMMSLGAPAFADVENVSDGGAGGYGGAGGVGSVTLSCTYGLPVMAGTAAPSGNGAGQTCSAGDGGAGNDGGTGTALIGQ
jgi:hypothetical protein